MSDSSVLLPLVVGAINPREESSIAQVDCGSPESSDDSTKSIEGYSLLYPQELPINEGNSGKEFIPLLGGSIIKIPGIKNVSTSIHDDVDEELKGRNKRINRRIINQLDQFKESVENVDAPGDGDVSNLTNLVQSLRMPLNKALNKISGMNTYDDVADLFLSSYFDAEGSYGKDDSAFQSSLDEYTSPPGNTDRDPSINIIGRFHFIPFEVLVEIAKAVGASEGFATQAGSASVTFGSMAEYFVEEPVAGSWITADDANLNDEHIARVILEYLPIYKMEEEDIFKGGSKNNLCGFFTVYEENIYLKMPDVSGQDSAGFSSNIYGLGDVPDAGEDEEDTKLFLLFELENEEEDGYRAISVSYQPPANPTVLSNFVEMVGPEDVDGLIIELDPSGLDVENSDFYLSPILPDSTNVSISGLATSVGGIEIFTAPVLAKPFWDTADGIEGSGLSEVEAKSIISVETGSDESLSGDEAKNQNRTYVKNIMESLFEQVSSSNIFSSFSLSEDDSSSVVLWDYLTENFAYSSPVHTGLPLLNDLSPASISKLDILLGEKNRPELLLGAPSNIRQYRKNNRKYYREKVAGTTELLISNKPRAFNIAKESGYKAGLCKLIPGCWKKNEDVSENEDGNIEVAFKSRNFVDINPPGLVGEGHPNNVKFALYVMDKAGQLVRAPGPSITMEPSKPYIAPTVDASTNELNTSGMSQSGYFGHTPLNIDTIISARNSWKIRGESLLQVSGGGRIEFWSGMPDEEDATLVRAIYDGDEHGTLFYRHTDTLIDFYNPNPIGTWLSGGLRGELRIRVVDEAGNASSAEPIHIADIDVIADDLPTVNPDDAIITIKDAFNEFRPLRFQSDIVECWPIASNGVSGKIKVKSSSKLFKDPAAKLYAYPVISASGLSGEQDFKEILNSVSYASRRVMLDGFYDRDGNHLSDSAAFLDIYHEFSPSSSDDFGRISNKKAYISFPGTAFVGLNFSQFEGINKAHILITSKKLEDFDLGDVTDSPEYGEYMLTLDGSNTGGASDSENSKTKNRWGIIQIGGGENGNPAFIGPPVVTGLVAKVPGKDVQSSILKPNADSYLAETLKDWGMTDFVDYTGASGGPITSGSTIDRLLVMVQGAHEFEIGKRYKFYFDNKKLKKNIFKRLRSIKAQEGTPPSIVGMFKDITANGEGFLPVSARYKSKAFHTTFYSTHYEKITYEVNSGDSESTFEVLNSGDVAIYGFDYDEEAGTGEKTSDDIKISESVVLDSGTVALESTVLAPDYGTQWNSLYENKDLITKYNSPIQIVPQGVSMQFGLLVGDSSEFEFFEIDQFGILHSKGTLADLVTARGMAEQADALLALSDKLEAFAEAGGDLADIPDDLSREIDGLKDVMASWDKATEDARATIASSENASGEAEDTDVSPEDIDEYTDVGGGDGSDALESASDAVEGAADTLDEAVGDINECIDAIQEGADAISGLFEKFSDALSSAAGMLNQLAGELEDAVNNLAAPYADRDPNIYYATRTEAYLPSGSEFQASSLILSDLTLDESDSIKLTLTIRVENGAAIKCNVPEIIRIRADGEEEWYGVGLSRGFGDFSLQVGQRIELQIENAKRDIKLEIAGKRIQKRAVEFNGSANKTGLMTVTIQVPENLQGISVFGGKDCIKLSASNTNVNSMRLARQVGNDFAIDLDKKSQDRLFGPLREKTPNMQNIIDRFKNFPLRLPGGVIMDQMGAAKEHINSFCDLSFYLTKDLDLSLRNFKWILIPIKIILCIIDVICALLNPWKLAIAIIRLFLCLWDLLLLLPQISVPVMFLSLVLHLLELLQCILIKIITTITAINEIIAALDTAIAEKNYPAVMALEEAINEHIFSLEADLSALQPILQILALFLELLQLLFNFPCRIADETIDPTCIDPSLLAGILIGKAAPNGEIVADNLLPVAQTYTTLEVEDVGVDGNTPSNSRDDGGTVENVDGGTPNDILKESSENVGKVVMTKEATEEDDLTDEELEERTYFDGTDIDAPSLRTTGQDFDATFAVSFTKSKKGIAVFTGPDPRIVEFLFKERGLTNNLAWTPFIGIFFRKKTIDHLQTLDSPPRLLKKSGDEIKVSDTDDDFSLGFVSPIDGMDEFLNGSVGTGFHPKPLTVTLVDKQATGEVDDDGQPVFEDTEYEQTFDGIPMFAIIDEEFNVYFIRDNGIKMESTGIITSIEAMMINQPSAPKMRSSREDMEVFRDVDGTDGETIVKKQANADYIIGSDPLDEGFDEDASDDEKVSHSQSEIEEDYPDAPYQDAGSYNHMTKTKDRKKLEAAIDSIKVFDFPQLYFVDVRQAAEELASACNASSLNNLLMSFALGDVDYPADDGSGEVDPSSPSPADIIENQLECTQEFIDYMRENTARLRSRLAEGSISVEDQWSIFDVREKQLELEDCCRQSIDDICLFVINPLNTGFKLLEDEDEEALPGFVDPEEYSEDPFLLESEEIDTDDSDILEIESHKITGAREYAAGIGDMAVVPMNRYATIEIVPRDSYDNDVPGDLLEKISVEIVKDDTSGAEFVVIEDDNYEVSESGFIAREEDSTKYFARITSSGLGKVTIRGSVCNKTIRAVTLAGLKKVSDDDGGMEDDFGIVDCIPDSGDSSDASEDSGEVFSPGQLTKIDRILTVVFKEPGVGDADDDGIMGLASAEDIREESAESAKSLPQGSGSNLDN